MPSILENPCNRRHTASTMTSERTTTKRTDQQRNRLTHAPDGQVKDQASAAALDTQIRRRSRQAPGVDPVEQVGQVAGHGIDARRPDLVGAPPAGIVDILCPQ